MSEKTLKELWIEALRSGNYSQTNNVLKDSEGYCCLGVFCDISGMGTWQENYGRYEFVLNNEYEGYLELDVELNDILMEAAGITREQQTTLVAANDEFGEDFSKIADRIEQGNYKTSEIG